MFVGRSGHRILAREANHLHPTTTANTAAITVSATANAAKIAAAAAAAATPAATTVAAVAAEIRVISFLLLLQLIDILRFRASMPVNWRLRFDGAPATLGDMKVLAALTVSLARARLAITLAHLPSLTLNHPRSPLSARPIESLFRDPFLAPGQRGRFGLPRRRGKSALCIALSLSLSGAWFSEMYLSMR